MPGDLLETLTNPSPLVSFSANTFTLPNDRTLDPNTTYWITINEGLSGSKARVNGTSRDTEDSAYGWTIGDSRFFKTSQSSNWLETSSILIRMAVSGTVRTASTDATLSSLSLEDANSGDAIALDPGFARYHLDYAASMRFPVSRITVTPTKNDPNARIFPLRDGDDNDLSDADTSQSGFQVDLVAGAQHVIKVVVASEAGFTETYTVTVTRAPEPGQVLLSTKLLSLTEGNGAYYSVRLNRQPAANVTVTIGGHGGTNVTPNPASLTFTTSNWRQLQWVFVSATADANTRNESVTLTHEATSSDIFFDDFTIPGVIVNVDDADAPNRHIPSRRQRKPGAYRDVGRW